VDFPPFLMVFRLPSEERTGVCVFANSCLCDKKIQVPPGKREKKRGHGLTEIIYTKSEMEVSQPGLLLCQPAGSVPSSGYCKSHARSARLLYHRQCQLVGIKAGSVQAEWGNERASNARRKFPINVLQI
jgi:hypothetical protein